MAKISTDELLKQQSLRVYVQWGGARPANKLAYGGVNAQYMFIDGVSNPVQGDISPIRVPHPRIRNAFKLVGRSFAAADLPGATLNIMEKRKAIPRQLMNGPCEFNFYEYAGSCADLSDQLAGWDDYVLVYSGAVANSADLGARTSRDSDDPLTTQLACSLNAIYPVGRLAFGEQAAATVATPTKDAVYGNSLRCSSCGPANDGTRWIYTISDGAAGAKANLVYSVDGGVTWAAILISTTANSDLVASIRIMGNILFVTVIAASISEIHWTTINPITGVPSTSFTKVTTGFVAAKNTSDAFVVNASDVWFTGKGGYLYRSSDVSAGVTAITPGTLDFLRIHGDGDQTLLAVGATGHCYKSVNGGLTWAATTTSPEAANLTAVCVLDEFRFWVGSVTGKVYYTVDGGETWTQHTGCAVGASLITDIIAPTNEVIHVAATVSSVGKIFTSWTGGVTWTALAPRISGLATSTAMNRLAAPTTDNPAVDANNLVGAATATADGGIHLGVAAVL